MTAEKQPELFGEFKEAQAASRFFGKGELPEKTVVFTFTREKLILSILGAIVILAVVFAFGFEQGKKNILAKLTRRPAAQPVMARPNTAAEPVNMKAAKAPVMQEAPRPAQVKPKAALKPYTIQVATFRSKDYAMQEAIKLRNKGFSTSIIGINGLYQVWAGDYSSTKEAEQALNTLKKAYNGCYIRKR